MNGVLLALLLAQAAADAGVGADAHGSLALVLVGAGHVDLLGHRDLRDQMAGAGLGAGHAVGALVRVHHGGAVGTDGTDNQKLSIVSRLLSTTDYVDFKMNYDIDESLIAGMVIRIGDRVVDSSIKHKIDELTRNLKNIQLA